MKTKIVFLSVVLTSVWMSLSSQYSTDDMNALLAIDDSCDVNNQLNWNTAEPHDWNGVSWNSSTPKRIYSIAVSNKQLAGTLTLANLSYLEYLNCWNNQLTDLKLSHLDIMKTLICQSNQLDTLDVTALTALSYLYCDDNQIKYLNIKGMDNLIMVYSDNNALTSLELSGLPNLAHLNCDGNLLDSLDISNATSLSQLYCNQNKITKLNAGASPELVELYCADNLMDDIDVSDLSNLTQFDCSNNQLTRLDLSSLSNMTGLYISGNKLDSIDLSNMPILKVLICDTNQLTNLDVSHSLNIHYLSCAGNHLDTLDLSMLTKLQNLFCNDNQLDTFSISALANLYDLDCYDNQLPFTTLVAGLGASHFNYTPQDTLYEPILIYKDTLINYSLQALAAGKPTEFIFFNNNIPVDTNNTGLFATTGFGNYFCEMTNDTFPGLTLVTSVVSVAGLSVSDNDLEISQAANSTATFDITANVSWYISSSESWLTFVPEDGLNNASVTLTAEANPDTISRTTTITVLGAGVDSVVIYVKQAPKAFLLVSDNKFEIGQAANSTASFDIVSNTDWTITKTETWLILSSTSGFGSESITITADANTNTTSRNATITVSGTGVDTVTISVTQPGIPVSGVDELFNENELVYPNPVNEKLSIQLTSNDLPAIIQVYSFDGKQMLLKETNSSLTELEMENLHSGIYILKIATPAQTIEKKIIKQ